jgi:hypothetical protein
VRADSCLSRDAGQFNFSCGFYSRRNFTLQLFGLWLVVLSLVCKFTRN